MDGNQVQQPNFDHPVNNLGKAPKALGQYTTVNGRTVATNTYGGKGSRPGFYTNINYTPDEQSTVKTAQQGVSGLLPSIRSALATTPQEQDAYTQALYKPQAAQLQNQYDKALGDTVGNANANGVLNSTGFESYRANQLDKNLNQGLSDLYNQSLIQGYQLPGIKLAPIESALGAYDNANQNVLNRGLSVLNPTLNASNMGLNFANNSYTGQQQQLMNQLKAQLDARQSNALGSGMFGSLFSGLIK